LREWPRGEKAHSSATLSDSGAFVWRALGFATNEGALDSGSGKASPGIDDEREWILFVIPANAGIETG